MNENAFALKRIKELEDALRPFAVEEVEGLAGYTTIDANGEAKCKIMSTFGDVRKARKALNLD